MNKQKKFPGGLILEGHKQPTEIIESTIPAELTYPLLQRADYYVKPIVKLGEYVLKGQVIATSHHIFNPPVHAASSGTIKEISSHLIAHRSNLSDTCIVIETDGLDNAVNIEPCANYQFESPEKLRIKIHQAGVVGLGGAIFPTAKKLETGKTIHTLIINAAECEPYISCDESLIQAYGKQLVQGALVMQYILQAERCIIAIEDNMPFALKALEMAIKTCDIQLVIVPAIYPTGGEKQLIEVITGIKIKAQSLPAKQGIICQNVGTVYAVYQAIYLGTPLTERIITLAGEGIKKTQNMRVKIGTPIKHLIEQCGGYNQHANQLIMGGSMMGISLSTDEISVTKATNCLLVMTNEDELFNEVMMMSCIRCGDCVDVCPVGLLPQQLYWYSNSGQLDQCVNYQLFDCIECGCCDVVCPSQIPLVQAFLGAKREYMVQEKQIKQARHAKIRYENQKIRFVRIEKEKKDKVDQRKAMIEKMKAAAVKRKIDD